ARPAGPVYPAEHRRRRRQGGHRNRRDAGGHPDRGADPLVSPAGQPLVAPASPAHPRSARVRRHHAARPFDPTNAMAGTQPRVLRGGDLVLDESRWTVHRAGTLVDLSPTEFRLLACLLRDQGSVLTRAELLERVWGRGYTGQPQVVETYVSYLRRKLHRLGP